MVNLEKIVKGAVVLGALATASVGGYLIGNNKNKSRRIEHYVVGVRYSLHPDHNNCPNYHEFETKLFDFDGDGKQDGTLVITKGKAVIGFYNSKPNISDLDTLPFGDLEISIEVNGVAHIYLRNRTVSTYEIYETN